MAAFRAGSPLYPASAHRRCGRPLRGFGRLHTIRSKVVVSSFTSCTLAPLATSDSGTPRASTNKLLLRPFFSLIRRVRPHAFSGQRSFPHGPVDALPVPGDALHFVVLGQSGSPYLEKKTFLLPALKIGVHGAGTAVLLGQRLPLTAGAKHIDNRREDLPRRHRLATRSRLAPILPSPRPLSHWNQRLNLAPQHVRHCPRLDLRHLEEIFAQLSPSQTTESVTGITLNTIHG